MPRPSLQCLDPVVWITDDTLAEAYTRFARVSHYNTYTCRRFGSNVPGPLEARRRLARRRMGLAAVAASNGPPPFDLVAMLGFGGKAAVSVEKAWTWEPPSNTVRVPGLGAGPPPPPTKSAAWLRPAKDLFKVQRAEVRDDGSFVAMKKKKPAEDAIHTSARAFEVLLCSYDACKEIDHDTMVQLVHFLQSSADEPKAMNLRALHHWLD